MEQLERCRAQVKTCKLCGGLNTTTGKYCNTCYGYLRKHPEGLYPLPDKGVVCYALNGDPICHICGQAHRKLGSHIRNKHDMSQTEYRDKFNLYRNTKLSNKEYQEMMSNYVDEYYDKVVKDNLINKGMITRITSSRIFEVRRRFQGPIEQVYYKR
jgi:hypothetical protein